LNTVPIPRRTKVKHFISNYIQKRMRISKVIITLTILLVAVVWFLWAFKTNPERDSPTFSFFPQFVYIEHFAVGFAAPLGIYGLVYLIILPLLYWVFGKQNYFRDKRNTKEKKIDLYIIPILSIAIILLFEAWYQFYSRPNSSSQFQFIITLFGCVPFWLYIQWLWK
jgi:hypothetical protein